MSSGERRRRVVELSMQRDLGRQPSVDELNAALASAAYRRIVEAFRNKRAEPAGGTP